MTGLLRSYFAVFLHIDSSVSFILGIVPKRNDGLNFHLCFYALNRKTVNFYSMTGIFSIDNDNPKNTYP